METQLQPLLRRRQPPAWVPHTDGPSVGVEQPESQPYGSKRLGTLPAIMFSVTYTIFVVTGMALTLMPPRVRSKVAGQSIPPDAKCYRVIRKADYVTVEYAIGGPVRRVQVLLRLDKVVGDLDNSVRLFGERLIESKSMQCDSSNSSCFDTVLLTDGPPNEPLHLVGLQFEYTNPTVEREKGDVARYRLNLAGEMYAAKGYRYYLSNTHLCVSSDATAEVGDTSGALLAHVTPSNFVKANVTNIAGMPIGLLGHAAVYQAAHHEPDCKGELNEIDVFPYVAASEILYLAITDPNIYETEPTAVMTRREIVELGYICASVITRYERAFNFYDFDCNNIYAFCRTTPSLPFRRVATYDVRAHYTQDGQVVYWLEPDPSLATLPGMANSAEAVLFAIVKLAMLILAAAVMWVRSDRVTSASHWLYRHCIRVANCQPIAEADSANASVLEDAMLGLTACGARVAVVVWRWSALQSENQSRVCYTELIAAGLSFASWVARFWVIEPNLPDLIDGKRDGRGPLTRLGGSMAIVDASCAVLLAFAEPPIHLSNVSRFDDTARLLGGLVVALVTLNRCLFAVACNAVMIEAHQVGRVSSSDAFVLLVTAGLLMWIGQAIAIAVVLADLVASPMAFMITRGVIGDDTAVGMAMFMALVCVSLPRLMHTAVKLIE